MPIIKPMIPPSIHDESPPPDARQYVVFRLDGNPYGVGLSAVSRVVHAAMITPLPQAPAIVMGVIRLGDLVVPVVNTRRRFRLPERELAVTDKFVVACAAWTGADRALALVVDAVDGVLEVPARSIVSTSRILPGLEYLEGVAMSDAGIVLIHDLGSFLSLDEEGALSAALAGRPR